MSRIDPRLCCSFRLDGQEPAACAARAAESGATLLVAVPGAVTSRTAASLLAGLRRSLPSPVGLLVCGRSDIAVAADLDGVHLGQDDLTPAEARRLLGPDRLIALTVTDPAQADELYRWKVDLAVIGVAGADVSADGARKVAFRVRLASGGTRAVVVLADGQDPAAFAGRDLDGVMVELRGPGADAAAKLRELRARLDAAPGRPPP